MSASSDTKPHTKSRLQDYRKIAHISAYRFYIFFHIKYTSVQADDTNNCCSKVGMILVYVYCIFSPQIHMFKNAHNFTKNIKIVQTVLKSTMVQYIDIKYDNTCIFQTQHLCGNITLIYAITQHQCTVNP